jgi:hypothetical protein
VSAEKHAQAALQKQWVIPLEAAFVSCCLARRDDEAAHQGDPHGGSARHDYEYERNGIANPFTRFAPLEGWPMSRSPLAAPHCTVCTCRSRPRFEREAPALTGVAVLSAEAGNRRACQLAHRECQHWVLDIAFAGSRAQPA